jgi:hypothetical protein
LLGEGRARHVEAVPAQGVAREERRPVVEDAVADPAVADFRQALDLELLLFEVGVVTTSLAAAWTRKV